MSIWNEAKKLVGYRKEELKETHVTEPVRVEGKPAKHLEKVEVKKSLHITEGWFKKSTWTEKVD